MSPMLKEEMSSLLFSSKLIVNLTTIDTITTHLVVF